MTDSDQGVRTPIDVELDDVATRLVELESVVSSHEERREVRRVQRMLKHVPGSDHIRKFTTRDIAEASLGGIVFSLPLLVEDGVFDIAAWLASITLGPVPILLVGNVFGIVGLVAGMLYFTDFRSVAIRPVFGVIPRRLLAIVVISLTVATTMMLLWGRLHEGSPSSIEVFARITVLWTAAALGASLGDLLPGESTGTDLQTRSNENREP